MLKISNLSKTYPNGVEALKKASRWIFPSECTACSVRMAPASPP